jgi:glucosyl-3-phosphoglycerate synthase
MADFYQTGLLATFHRLGALNLERLEHDIEEFNKHRPLALVLPTTPKELGSPALRGILANIKDIKYLNEVVITLGRTDDPAHFAQARKLFSVLPQRHKIVWASGPRFLELYKLLETNDLSAGADGKGRSAWTAYGYILAREESKAIGLHDCDIVNHSREMVGRLFYPVASPHIDYAFCKGYYARVTDRMHGRVTRLFVTPLVRSLIKLFGHLPFLVYLDSFRYALAGEFSMITELARINRIPSDWGLEVETLAEVYRNYSLRRVCQAEICETYEHKHQPLSAEDPKTGLMKMAIDIAKSVLRNLAVESIILSESALRTLVINYQRTAKDAVKRYRDDADYNGLAFDYHLETVMVEAFTRAIQIAGQEFMDDPLYSPLIPSWNRVTSAIPDFLDRLRAAVEEDNAGSS